MFKKKLASLLILVCILSSMLFIMPSQAATVRHVGPGQTYNGTTDAVIQQAVNAASSGDTIYIHAATYTFNHTVKLKSGLKVKGDGVNKTIIYGTASACNTESEPGYFYANNVSNIEIYGLTFKSASTGPTQNGKTEYKVCIRAISSSNITVHDCSAVKWIYNDFFKASHSTDLKMYNCNVVTGHAAAYFFKCKRCQVYKNKILVYTNAGIRGDGTTENCKYYNNTIWCEAYSGQAAFEFQNASGGTEMHHNLVYDFSKSFSHHCVVQNAGGVTGTISFHDNVYWNCSGGVQVGSGTGNKVNPADHNVSNWIAKGYGW